jgi:hypothetical protein
VSAGREVELRLHRGRLRHALVWAVPVALVVAVGVAAFGLQTGTPPLRAAGVGLFGGVAVGLVVGWLRYSGSEA